MNQVILNNIGQEAKKSYYPTPEALAEHMAEYVDWERVSCAIEPSAGAGNLVKLMTKKIASRTYRGHVTEEELLKVHYVDCIESDFFLRAALKEEGFHVVADDFLMFETEKRYDLCFMNPPFNQGARHLLHALRLMKNGGQIVCLLNAETIRNVCNADRADVQKLLNRYEAKIEFINDAFSHSDRKTDVEIALVYVDIPKTEKESFICSKLKKEMDVEHRVPDDVSGVDIARWNIVDQLANKYLFEVRSGVSLIEEYKAIGRTIGHDLGLGLNVSSINEYVTKTRLYYWNLLFTKDEVFSHLTYDLKQKLHGQIEELKSYDFSAYNIFTLLKEVSQNLVSSIEETIEKLFDRWTACGWNQESPNRHYYNGWKTNSSFAVGKKVILPMYAFDSWDNSFDSFKVVSQFEDIEKVFDFLDGNLTDGTACREILRQAEKENQTKHIQTKYFDVTFYKRGTAHLVFKNEKLLEKFNIFAGRKKNWLPDAYGKKNYTDMTDEEKKTVDSFQGKEKYEEVMRNSSYYLMETSQRLLSAPID